MKTKKKEPVVEECPHTNYMVLQEYEYSMRVECKECGFVLIIPKKLKRRSDALRG